ncbi:unnamed protein product [Rotaria magnacalcarata]|uniref:Cation efflux protein transmembrane domain-containing protein n=3 Tax=Rotaria magnacalcarata TaxID=392030 RepID=A0A815SY72_9BILA|nr:unnamed protein product [Rotaria magnacalcarata]CAF1496941.1 unnamed protein product [Rotaria magnacalcarata]CAF2116794.1 unnamed protein product [Rotaria magnacalcarata]CAF2134998.1 unnamed protein product [Rotaria magnacalcarata]CAF3780978.1 unnamed protein product [Rotaria magnacalcarata]
MVLLDKNSNNNGQTIVIEDDSSRDKLFKRYQSIAYRVCVFTIILDIILGLTAFINCMLDKSSVGLSYSIDTLMDSICICFVAWHLKAQTMDDFKRRDYLVCCVIGALFIGSFLAIESRAIQSMLVPQAPTGDWLLLLYSVIHISIFTVLSIVKIILSKKLNSKSLMADALNSIIGIIMAVPLILWDRIPLLSRHTQFDDLISVLMALFLLVMGCKLVHSGITYHNKLYSESLNSDTNDINVNSALLTTVQMQVAGRPIAEDTHRQYMNLDRDVETTDVA